MMHTSTSSYSPMRGRATATAIRATAIRATVAAVITLAGCDRASANVSLAEPVAASLPTGVGAAPVIALSPAGTRAVAWVSAPGGGTDGRLYVSVGDAAPVELRDTLGPIEAHGEAPPKLVFDGTGTLHAIYVVAKLVPGRRFPAAALRYVRSADTGRTWTAPVNVTDAETFGSNNFHALHASADGVLYASWLDGREGKSATYMTRSTDGGTTWSANRRVAPGESCPCCRTAIATAPGGHVYLAWRAVLPGNVRDVVVAHSADGGETFGAPVRVHADDWVFDACPHAGPSLQTDAKGRLHVAWWTGKEKVAGVYYARSDDLAQRFSRPVALGIAEFSRPAHVQLAVGADGLVVVTWDDGTLEVPEVKLRASTDDGARFGPAVRVSSPGAWATFPMLRLAGRSVTVVWSEEPTADAQAAEHAKHAAGKAPMGLSKVGASRVFLRTASVR